MSKNISIVIPVYNESAGIEYFHNKLLLPELKKIKDTKFTTIYVNDGSQDDSLKRLHKIAQKQKDVIVLNLAKNFGKEIAVTAGIFHARGDCTIIMDSDGQHPPAKIGDLIEGWRKGGQVVVGIRNQDSAEGIIKRAGSRLFYQLFNATAGVELIPRSTDFRLIDECVRNEFLKFSERNRITRGLIDWLGFERKVIYFDAPARFAGKASYSIRRLAGLAMNSFISLSIAPLLWLVFLGVIVTVGSLILALATIFEHIILQDPMQLNVSGTAYLVIFVTFLVGLVLTSQGIMAIYLSHVHSQSQARPLYIVDRRGSVRVPR